MHEFVGLAGVPRTNTLLLTVCAAAVVVLAVVQTALI